ncbi:helix-hairpin-helix domain-containing protein [Mucilaginibacter sp. UR6-1]|uniref:helix-hairpin-helix domain-containing protein n=1 Tax=Mucilaginibacter sp. UR6-1 TaxID=1435643 RepID=UPI001E4D3104|nr:helix-hairpin-helix domain-containing protein [Mucilaginibacter sp. UR6-1]MCC8409571.1 helix-hairpin-helix domain-containing protein [Mucilaginibacter sp. UR6-1]
MAYLLNHLAISKKTWNGLVVLFIIVAAVPFIKNAFNGYAKPVIDKKQIITLSKHLSSTAGEHHNFIKTISKFNPDTLSSAGWRNLGLSERQVAVIMHYKQKGGRFYSKADVAKLYTISPEKYKQLEPFIDLPVKGGAYPHKQKLIVPVELNHADSATLTTVYGIGPAFASRIIKYRTLLGGYNTKQQLMEVYGLNAEKYAVISDQLRVDAHAVKKINVNMAEADELNRLPYLNYKQANAIVQYRVQHGEYLSADDLADIVILDPRTIQQIKPYLIYK